MWRSTPCAVLNPQRNGADVRGGWGMIWCMSLRVLPLAAGLLSLAACFEGGVIDPPGSGGSGAASGQGGGGQGSGGGQTVCEEDADCTDVNECAVAVCLDDLCNVVNIPAGTAPATQPLGDCSQLECDGDGAIVSVPDSTDVPSADECASYACSADGMVETTFALEGTPCGVALECNAVGVCVGCTQAADCFSGACEVATCVAEECGVMPAPSGTIVVGDLAENCLNTICDGSGGVVVTPDDLDLPASDSNPCTTEACSNGSPVHTPKTVGITVSPENGVPCNGVCQTGAYAGECGLRLYSRPFPMAGGWTSTALTAATGWSGANAPPPTAITAADESSNGSRTIVVRQVGGTSTYYELIGGAWQSPVPLSSVSALGNPALAALSMGDFGAAGELAVFLTVTTPLTAYQYAVPATGPLVHQATVNPIPNPADPWRCQQGTFPILWGFTEQRSPYGQNPAPRAWKLCNGMVYEENNNDFTGMSAPTTEANSPFQITGSNGSPAPGSVAAAYYRKSINTVFMIAP